jgi:hypothetical protein
VEGPLDAPERLRATISAVSSARRRSLEYTASSGSSANCAERVWSKLPDGVERPTRVPETLKEHFRLMADLQILARATGSRRFVVD